MAVIAKPLSQLGLVSPRDISVTGLAVDSRQVGDGYLFAGLPGSNVHGAEFIQYALRQGATAILTDAAGVDIARDHLAQFNPVVIQVENPRQALAGAAALFYAAQPATMVAVTGTNGKTSVSTFCRQLWEDLGENAVNLGTTGVEGAWTAPCAHTTPEPITLHALLAQAADHGITHAAMEASSHGLAQHRMDGVRLMVAGFTNLSQDHLDYHADFDDYFNAKMGLFARVLSDDGILVVNCDDPRADQVLAHANGRRCITVGHSDAANVQILGQRFHATGQDIRFGWGGEIYQTSLPLVGGFQGENLLLAAAMVHAAGTPVGDVVQAMGAIKPARGRMELAATRQNGAPVYVDYAHTPDAVATALQALRPHVMGRLVVVLGAGGDRDPSKRVHMGQAAARHADVVFITDDNPRSEDAASIRQMVMAGAPGASEVGDRAEAILRGVDALGPGDCLLIAGKGHETGQLVGDTLLPFDDVEQASIAVAALDGGMI